MKELNDINLGTNMIVLKDNHVTSAILPKNSAELQQNITIDENSRIIAEKSGRR